jgi:hypothetical protein
LLVARDPSNEASVATKLTIVTSAVAILGWFGVSNWHDFAAKVLHIGTGNASGATAAQPPGKSLFPVSFSYNGTAYTATYRPDSWSKYGCAGLEAHGTDPAVPRSVTSIDSEYQSSDTYNAKIYADVCLYQNDSQAASAEAWWESESPMLPYYLGTQGDYKITVSSNLIPEEDSALPGAESALAAQILMVLPDG